MKDSNNKSISEVIRQRITSDKGAFFANDNISQYIEEGEIDLLKIEVADKVREVLKSLVIDIDHDSNTQETAQRIAKMYIDEVFRGRYQDSPKVTFFPNQKSFQQMYGVGPIRVRSTCSHHFVPIMGNIWVAVLPTDKVIGISKFNRIIDWVMSRPHIQEDAIVILADILEKQISPKGLGLIIQCQHYCMSWRGVKDDNTLMTNTLFRGELLDNEPLQRQFYNLVNLKKGTEF